MARASHPTLPRRAPHPSQGWGRSLAVGGAQPAPPAPRTRVVEYDAMRRRLWILGQRCHHGATGSLVAVVACLGMATSRQARRPLIPLAATGGLLMAHDWKDRSDWFRPGYGSQP